MHDNLSILSLNVQVDMRNWCLACIFIDPGRLTEKNIAMFSVIFCPAWCRKLIRWFIYIHKMLIILSINQFFLVMYSFEQYLATSSLHSNNGSLRNDVSNSGRQLCIDLNHHVTLWWFSKYSTCLLLCIALTQSFGQFWASHYRS